jgi:hypothetical protein
VSEVGWRKRDSEAREEDDDVVLVDDSEAGRCRRRQVRSGCDTC